MVAMSSTGSLSPKESGVLIVNKAQDVSIMDEGVNAASDLIYDALKSGELNLKRFKQCELHPQSADEKAIDWIFLVDTLNFSFWSGISEDGNKDVTPPKWEVKYKGKTYTGYFALCAAVNRAIEEEGLDLTNPKVYGALTTKDILRICRSETSTPIPLLEQRVSNLQEAAKVLIEKYDGSFVNCLKSSDKSAQRLMNQVVTDFPSYRDESPFGGSVVSLYKRVQILIADIWACFEGQGLGSFDDIESLTMFADYRIPQVLMNFGALKYSPGLLATLEKDELLENGDRCEVEIRGASIHIVELIKDKVQNRLKNDASGLSVNAILIDHFLWDYRREHAEALEKYPYHKTRCIYY